MPSLQSWVQQQGQCIKDQSNLDRTEASSRDEGRHELTGLSSKTQTNLQGGEWGSQGIKVICTSPSHSRERQGK